MPCGGIFFVGPQKREPWDLEDPWCFQCDVLNPPPDHMVLEWDGLVHGTCIEEFLKSDMGSVVLAHGHAVYRREPDGTETTLYEEKTPEQ